MSSGGEGKFMAAASTMTGSVLGLGAVGYYLDQRFNWHQYGILIGALLGLVIGLYELYKSIYMKDDNK